MQILWVFYRKPRQKPSFSAPIPYIRSYNSYIRNLQNSFMITIFSVGNFQKWYKYTVYIYSIKCHYEN